MIHQHTKPQISLDKPVRRVRAGAVQTPRSEMRADIRSPVDFTCYGPITKAEQAQEITADLMDRLRSPTSEGAPPVRPGLLWLGWMAVVVGSVALVLYRAGL